LMLFQMPRYSGTNSTPWDDRAMCFPCAEPAEPMDAERNAMASRQ